jgi:ATP-dependent protease HslVU (ClpYQ) peptidase subunit
MTCIAGMVDKNNCRVVMGGDSASSGSDNIFTRKDPKIFKNGEFVIGCTTSYRMIQLLRFSFTPPEIGEKDVYEYMCTDFINKVRECFKDGGFLQKWDDGDEKGGTFLVAYRDRLFKIEGDFTVGETLNGIDSVGCGQDFALGSLYSLLDQYIPTEDKVLKSLEAAEFLSLGVRRPFIIINTKD